MHFSEAFLELHVPRVWLQRCEASRGAEVFTVKRVLGTERVGESDH